MSTSLCYYWTNIGPYSISASYKPSAAIINYSFALKVFCTSSPGQQRAFLLLHMLTFLVVALICLVMETPAKLKKAIEKATRERRLTRRAELPIWVSASGKIHEIMVLVILVSTCIGIVILGLVHCCWSLKGLQ